MDLDDLRIPANRHGYIYLITFTRPTDGQKFYYVGQHIAKALSHRYVGSGVRINNLYRKYGKCGHKRLLLWAYSQDELNFYEQFCIHTAKAEYGGLCVNLSHGDTVRGGLSESSRAKISKAKSMPEARRHQSEVAKRMWADPIKREAIASKVKATLRTPENRKRFREMHLGRVKSPETCRKLSIANTGVIRSEESKRKQSETRRARDIRPDALTRIKMSEAQLKHYALNPERGAKISKKLKGRPKKTTCCPSCGQESSIQTISRWHGLDGSKCTK